MMLRKPLQYGAVLACGVLALTGLSAAVAQQNNKADKPAMVGTWVQKGGEVLIEFGGVHDRFPGALPRSRDGQPSRATFYRRL